MSENAPSTPQETPSSSAVLDSFSDKQNELQSKVTDLENQPGFRRNAEELVRHKQELKIAKEALSSFSKERDELGGSEIDEAQKAVDALNFRSSADDHIKAKAALRDAKDRFYANFTKSQDETADEEAPAAVTSPEHDDDDISLTSQALVGDLDTTTPDEPSTEEAPVDYSEEAGESDNKDSEEPTEAEELTPEPTPADNHETDEPVSLDAHIDELDEALPAYAGEISDEQTPEVPTPEAETSHDEEPQTPEQAEANDDTSPERKSRKERRNERKARRAEAKDIKKAREAEKRQLREESKIMEYQQDIRKGTLKWKRLSGLLRNIKYVKGDPRLGLRFSYDSSIDQAKARERYDTAAASAALNRLGSAPNRVSIEETDETEERKAA